MQPKTNEKMIAIATPCASPRCRVIGTDGPRVMQPGQWANISGGRLYCSVRCEINGQQQGPVMRQEPYEYERETMEAPRFDRQEEDPIREVERENMQAVRDERERWNE